MAAEDPIDILYVSPFLLTVSQALQFQLSQPVNQKFLIISGQVKRKVQT